MRRKTIGSNPLDEIESPAGKGGPRRKPAAAPKGARAEIRDAILKPVPQPAGLKGLFKSLLGRLKPS